MGRGTLIPQNLSQMTDALHLPHARELIAWILLLISALPMSTDAGQPALDLIANGHARANEAVDAWIEDPLSAPKQITVAHDP